MNTKAGRYFILAGLLVIFVALYAILAITGNPTDVAQQGVEFLLVAIVGAGATDVLVKKNE